MAKAPAMVPCTLVRMTASTNTREAILRPRLPSAPGLPPESAIRQPGLLRNPNGSASLRWLGRPGPSAIRGRRTGRFTSIRSGRDGQGPQACIGLPRYRPDGTLRSGRPRRPEAQPKQICRHTNAPWAHSQWLAARTEMAHRRGKSGGFPVARIEFAATVADESRVGWAAKRIPRTAPMPRWLGANCHGGQSVPGAGGAVCSGDGGERRAARLPLRRSLVNPRRCGVPAGLRRIRHGSCQRRAVVGAGGLA